MGSSGASELERLNHMATAAAARRPSGTMIQISLQGRVLRVAGAATSLPESDSSFTTSCGAMLSGKWMLSLRSAWTHSRCRRATTSLAYPNWQSPPSSGGKLRGQLATCEFADAFALLGICVGLCACLPTCLPKEGQRGEPGPWKRNHRGTTYTFTSVTTGRASCYPSRPNVDGGAQFFSTPCTPAAITARR